MFLRRKFFKKREREGEKAIKLVIGKNQRLILKMLMSSWFWIFNEFDFAQTFGHKTNRTFLLSLRFKPWSKIGSGHVSTVQDDMRMLGVCTTKTRN